MKNFLIVSFLFVSVISFSQQKNYQYKPMPTTINIVHEGIDCSKDETKTNVKLEVYKQEDDKWYTLDNYKAEKCNYMILLPIPAKNERNFRITFNSNNYLEKFVEVKLNGGDQRASVDLGQITLKKK
jgi:hypothetical protein